MKVTLPLMLPGVMSGALIAFVAASGEFVASILLYSYRTQPAAVAIYAEYLQQEYGTAAATGTLMMAVVFALAGSARALHFPSIGAEVVRRMTTGRSRGTSSTA